MTSIVVKINMTISRGVILKVIEDNTRTLSSRDLDV